jgi:hypothetical protein
VGRGGGGGVDGMRGGSGGYIFVRPPRLIFQHVRTFSKTNTQGEVRAKEWAMIHSLQGRTCSAKDQTEGGFATKRIR